MTEYKGMRFTTLFETKEVKRAVTEFNATDKVRLDDGNFAVVLSMDSYKYGSEVQLQYWSRKKPEVFHDRTLDHNGHYRSVIYFDPLSPFARVLSRVLDEMKKEGLVS